MVDTCPNCGQPSRAGARFCTSCGFRLPDRSVDSDSAPLARSPFATTSTVAASMWPSSAKSDPSASTESPMPEPFAPQTVGEEGHSALPDEIALPGPAPSEQPAEPIGSDVPVDGAPTEPVEEAEHGTESPTGTESDLSYPVWPSFPSYGETDNRAAPAWSAQDVLAATNEPDNASEGTVESHVDDAYVTQSAPDSASSESESDPIAAFVGRYGASYQPTASPDDAIAAPAPAVEHENIPVMVEATTENPAEPLERAQALLAELGALLPTLGTGAVASSTDASSDIVESLAAARSDDESEFDALIEAVAAVRARPRDIDVVLDLARHVESIVSLKERYDQSQAAINAALSRFDTE